MLKLFWLLRLNVLQKLRSIANYQFGSSVGKILFPENIEVRFSSRTGKVKEVYLDGKLLATLKPTGNLSLTVDGFKRIVKSFNSPRFRVIVQKKAAEFVKKGRNVFAKHVKNVDLEIRPGEEVVVVDKNDEVLAVGKAILSGREMLAFNRGVAVKVRHGIED